MRDELLNYSWADQQPITIWDFECMLLLTKDMIQAREILIQKTQEKVRIEQPDVAEDILDDLVVYTRLDCLYMWQFCLWRFQGLFEFIIVSKYLSHLPINELKKVKGFRNKLIKVKEVGYTLPDDVFNEFSKWGNIRNKLIHTPPGHYSYIPFEENDLNEYLSLIKATLLKWDEEEDAVKQVVPY